MLPRKPMDLRQLRYFQAVAAAGRITSAARELGITQPALSIALAKLEADLGVVLFDRDHRGVHLTESGRTLLTVVTQAMSLIEQGRQALTGLENEPVGRFVMGCPSALGCYLLPGLLPGLLEAFPRVELVIRAQTSRDVEAAVANRDVHFGLCTHPPQTADLVMLELFRDEVCVITPVTGGPAAAKAPRSWGEASALLRRSTMVYASAMPQAMEILDELTARNLAPAKRLDCGDVHMVAEATLAGLGLAILPRRVAAHRHATRLAPLHPRLPTVADTIRLIYRSDMHRTRAASLLTDAIVTKAKALGA
jgi:LysR family transcriptional regulator, cell division regulator